jgi:DNA polymerase-3 subunit gamma/tau
MSQALYRRWRPQRWDEIVGQDHIVQTLRNAVRAGRVAHAYLFAGPRGTGKTTTARLLAKAVNCLAPSADDRPCNQCARCKAVAEGRYLDLIEIDAASNTSVEDVRDLRDKINFAPNEGDYKVYIVDEVHMLSTAAFNALLKTLEEPPAHAIFVLATTEVHKIPATVLSRCQRHEFRRIPLSVIVEYLGKKAASEGLEVEPGVLELVSRQATGSMRDAISLLDQLASAGSPITLEGAEAVLGTAAGEAVGRVIDALVTGDVASGLNWINKALDGGADPRQFARQIVDALRGVLLARMGNAQLLEVGAETRAEMIRWSQALEIPRILEGIRAFNRAAAEARAGWQPGLALELAFVDTVQSQPADPSPPAAALPPRRPAPAPPTPNDPPAKASPPAAAQGSGDPAPAGPAGDVTFPAIVARWREVLAAARKRDPRTQALLNSCRPLGLEGGVLVLGFASDVLREKMEKGHSLALAREALREVFGASIEVRSALTSAGGADGRPEAPAEPMEENGMVATALRDLGAQVVEIKPVRPEDSR